MADSVVVAVSFVLMEAVSYLAHRFVMHGFAMGWHRSHHSARVSRFEKNDLFPVVFAGITVLAMAAGASLPSLHLVFVAGIGVTAYGAAYGFVHDIYIHGRLGRLPTTPVLERLRAAHAVHHLYGGEPYGMLFPVVPRSLRQRAASAPRDPFARSTA